MSRKAFMFLKVLALAVVALTNSPLYADSTIPIQNASFESYNSLNVTNCGTGCAYNYGPIPNWTLTGTGGSWQPGSNSLYFNSPLPDGNTVAWSSGGTISQDLGISLLPNSVYTLSVFVGDRLDGGSAGTYSLFLDAGGSPLGSLMGKSSDITPGKFAELFLTVWTGQSVSLGDLSIVLANSGGQADFDNVSLTVGQNTAVPEPTSLILLVAGIAFVGLFSLLRRT